MSAPDIDESDVQAVVEVLRSGRLALGPRLEQFERRMADYVGVRHAVGVSSGTAALHLIVRALGIGPGDEVLVPSFTFVASVNAILFEGATPVFVDIEPETYNLSPSDLERRVSPRTRAIMAVDVFGHPAEWDAILEIARRHCLDVIDDSCEALGAEYRGVKLGRLGRVAAFAFYPNKQMTTGEGGMLVTDDEALARLARSLRNQGRDEMGAWLHHPRLGYNYRLDELSAALGLSQLGRLETLLARRERVARLYTERLQGCSGVRPPIVRPHVKMSWFVYVVTLDEGIDREAVMRILESRGVPVRAYFPPAHLQPYNHGRHGPGAGGLPVTEAAARRTLALPFHNRLTEAEIERVVQSLGAAVEQVRAGG
jgi:perosamine synthetase